VWLVVVVILGVVSGYGFASMEWTAQWGEGWTTGGACVVLAVATVLGHVKVHPWWAVLAVWVAFMVGMVPPLSTQDALWIIAAVMFGVAAAVYVAVMNALVLAVRTGVRRRSRQRDSDGRAHTAG
jgi:hypothetical protein